MGKFIQVIKRYLMNYRAKMLVGLALILTSIMISAGMIFVGQNRKTAIPYTDNLNISAINNLVTENVISEDFVTPTHEITMHIAGILATEAPVTPTISATATNTPTPTTFRATASPSPTATKIPLTTIATPTPTPTPIITATISTTPQPTRDYSIPWPVTPGCPATTQNCVPCMIGTTYCRVEAGETHGFLGWACQNNNPGNIRPGLSKNAMIVNNGGVAPCGERSGYMVFANYSAGKSALKAYLKGISNGEHTSYRNLTATPPIICGECSLKFFFSIYAPAGDQNDPNSYANFVANRIGVNADTTTLSWIVANKLDAMADAIQVHEGWFTQ